MADEIDVTLASLNMAERAFRQRDRLHSALKAILDHWDEFGPEHGFDEICDRSRKVLSE